MSDNKTKKKKVFLMGLIVIPLLFVVPQTIQYFSYSKAEGTVEKLKQGIFKSLTGQATFNYPIVGFKNNTGHYVFYSKDNEVLYNVPSLGDKITVIYNPENPDEAWLNLLGSYWLPLPNLIIIVLLAIVWYGVVNIIFVKPRKKKAAIQKSTS